MDPFERSFEVMKRVKKLKESLHDNMSHVFKDFNLTGPQGMVVALLFRMNALKVSDLARRMGLSMSTVSGILDRLERDQIIYREKSPSDGRVLMVKLTEEFKKNSSVARLQMNRHWSETLNLATEEEIEILLKAIDIMERLVEESKRLTD